jgi:hypothetical protein
MRGDVGRTRKLHGIVHPSRHRLDDLRLLIAGIEIPRKICRNRSDNDLRSILGSGERASEPVILRDGRPRLEIILVDLFYPWFKACQDNGSPSSAVKIGFPTLSSPS